MVDAFPNLPKSKVCPACRRRFKRPIKTSGKPETQREWLKRTYCSNACRLAWFKRTEGFDG
ncbi:hypothetical protein LCGC14_0813820 [marine sediment metagenome]|uniref:Uncharacterized protein n=1 Tax=marine sediment metagenome TaxID=412755 RepID=A0A0F9PKZ2_9ZZZZ